MRYLPNLIPKQYSVLPDYFRGNIYKSAKRNIPVEVITWILGIFFFLSAITFILHPLLFLVNALIGFILIPPGHRFIERTLLFKLTALTKTVACLVLFFVSVPLFSHYSDLDQQALVSEKLAAEKAGREKEVADQKEAQREDSLFFYLQQSSVCHSQHNTKEANYQLLKALRFASTAEEKGDIERAKVQIVASGTHDLVKGGKYGVALPQINTLLQTDPSNSKLLYDRALCYSKTGNIQEAVLDLRQLMGNGNEAAEKLYNQINPIRKRVIGYETLCCDGSTSNARGQGACSHHGGVCDWNHPIYEESRKY